MAHSFTTRSNYEARKKILELEIPYSSIVKQVRKKKTSAIMVIVYYRTIDVYLNNKNNLFLKDFFVVYKSSSKLNNFSYFLRSKLFLESLSFISAELPSLLKSVMKTFASVPAPRTSPV